MPFFFSTADLICSGESRPWQSRSVSFPNRRRGNGGWRWCRVAAGVLKKTGAELHDGSRAREPRPDSPTRNTRRRACGLASREEVFAAADVMLQVRRPGANPESGRARPGAAPARADGDRIRRTADGCSAKRASLARARRVSFLAMELMPRITRAQSMDALSSMATIAGYKAVLMRPR